MSPPRTRSKKPSHSLAPSNGPVTSMMYADYPSRQPYIPLNVLQLFKVPCSVIHTHVLVLTALPSHRSRCTRYVCTTAFPAHGLDPRQALNTVLAFCSSRKSTAPTFDSIRGSVESLLKGWVPQIQHRESADSRIGRWTLKRSQRSSE